MDDRTKVKIFLDTNVIENGSYINIKKMDKYLVSNNFPINNDLKKLLDFITNNNIKDVIICIPLVVIMEIRAHLIDSYQRAKSSFDEIISSYKKVFGDCLNCTYEFKYNNEDDFIRQVDKNIDDFINKNKEYIRIIEYTNSMFPSLVNKAVNKLKPFYNAKGNGKEYSDAGFKDAVIWESILHDFHKHECQILIYSKDNDFEQSMADEFHGKILIKKDFEELINKLKEIYKLTEKDEICQMFMKNEYLWEIIQQELQLGGKIVLDSVEIISIEAKNTEADSDDQADDELLEAKENTIFTIIATACLDNDEQKNLYYIDYDSISNEILSVNS